MSVIALAFASVAPLVAQDPPSPPTIDGTGQVPYRVAAEGVDFQIVIEGKGNSAGQALAPCGNGVDSVRAALTRLALPTLTFEVIPQGVAPVTNSYGQPVTGERYMARTTLRVRLTDLRQLPRITAIALDAGATRLADFQWRSGRIETALRTAQDSAVALARRDAEQMAHAFGGTLGQLRNVNYGDQRTCPYYPNQDQTVQS
ncbi:MAG TPA: SIMPL domain-containing protein, partial [Gemmatimonadales bacterium]